MIPTRFRRSPLPAEKPPLEPPEAELDRRRAFFLLPRSLELGAHVYTHFVVSRELYSRGETCFRNCKCLPALLVQQP